MSKVTLSLLSVMISISATAWAQTGTHEMDHSQHQMAAPDASTTTDHSMHSAKPLKESGLRDPHAYSDGYDFGQYGKMHMADSMNFSSVMVDHLEAMSMGDSIAYGYGLKGWWGRDFNRLLVKSNGEASGNDVDALAFELLWGHAVAPFWNSTLGARTDTDGTTSRYSVALGITGLAPYWFETNAAIYVDAAGRIAFRGDVEYELLITQRLILQPMAEAMVLSRGDVERNIGGGLVDVGAALRLRYEIKREFAPYIGMEWTQKFGSSADYARATGKHESEMSAVAGLRLMI